MAQAQSVDRWEYRGDVNIEHGGTWFNLTDFDNGYVEAVRVEDLDSAAGARGMVRIEKINILTDNLKINAQAIESCGWLKGTTISPIELAEAVMLYGYYDPHNSPYRDYSGIVQLDPDEPMTIEGWTADRRMTPDELLALIESDYLT